MRWTSRNSIFAVASSLCLLLALAPFTQSQQTLGGITGTVTESTGSVLPGTVVTIVGDETKLTRSQTSNVNGSYDFVNLPIGSYTLTFTHEGFQTQRVPSIVVQANRTATVNPPCKWARSPRPSRWKKRRSPTRGHHQRIHSGQRANLEAVSIPPTGVSRDSPFSLPGVTRSSPAGTGANAGLGNQPIWANGQRDTSNSSLLNGVDASNLFNGKSTSQVASARIVNNTGVAARVAPLPK